MLEMVDFSQEKLSKEKYKEEYDALIKKLVVLQQRAIREKVGAVVLLEGWNGSGKGSRISDLVYNLDTRYTHVRTTKPVDTKEAAAFRGLPNGVSGNDPFMKEFWKALGGRNEITFFCEGWYSKAVDETGELALRAFADVKKGSQSADFACVVEKEFGWSKEGKNGGFRPNGNHLHAILNFEKQLACDGYAVLKIFLHAPKEALKKRLKKMRENPNTAWRVKDVDFAMLDAYEEVLPIWDQMLTQTSTGYSPWKVLNGADPRSANIQIAKLLISALEEKLAEKERTAKKTAAAAAGEPVFAPAISAYEQVTNTLSIDAARHDLVLPREDYKQQLKAEQKRLDALQKRAYQAGIPTIAMFEGWDAAGKGGAIKRVAQAIDARGYEVFTSPAPTATDLAHPHLWRYWTRLPKAGHVGLYDRSWYGRVLVERVEGFVTPERCVQAYDELNAFERDLLDWGAVLLKFWVDISPDEQLKRFEARMADPDKQWKITDEDWRNREKYPQYKAAIDDMFRLTSTPAAPWVLLEGDDKMFARVKALRTINDAIEARLEKAKR